jgi:hypothetical protein
MPIVDKRTSRVYKRDGRSRMAPQAGRSHLLGEDISTPHGTTHGAAPGDRCGPATASSARQGLKGDGRFEAKALHLEGHSFCVRPWLEGLGVSV